MIPIRSDFVRWVILVIGLALGLQVAFLPLTVGGLMGLGFLLVLTAASLILPPGIYGWLIHTQCPECGGPGEWTAVNPEGEPYNEQIVFRCRQCGRSKVEWSYRT